QVAIDPRFTGFAQVSDRRVTIAGYRITIDGRELSHDLTLFLLGNPGLLSRERAHELVLAPGTYPFILASGFADFTFTLGADGQVAIDPRFTGFAQVSDRRVTIAGYRITIDGRDLRQDLILIGGEITLPRDRINEINVIPAKGYTLKTSGESPTEYGFDVQTDGTIGYKNTPPGAIVGRPGPPPGTLRSFYASLFLPPGGSARAFRNKSGNLPSLRDSIRLHREREDFRNLWLTTIDALFDGGTDREEEERALGILTGTEHADDLVFLVNKLTWDQLDDELEERDLDSIMDHLVTLFDRRDYLVGFLVRWFYLVDNAVLPTLDFVNVLNPYANSRSTEVRHAFADQCLGQRDLVCRGIAHMSLRGRQNNIDEFRLALDSTPGTDLYRAADIQMLSWKAFYTARICEQLSRGEYRFLLQMLPDLVNPGGPQFPFPVRNIAFFDTLDGLRDEFAAMERVIEVVGSERQKSDARLYADKRKVFMDNFPAAQPPLPPPPAQPPVAFLAAIQQAIQAIATALGATGTAFQDLVAKVQNIGATIENISVPRLLGNLEDDLATAATNTIFSEGRLAFLPTAYKSELIRRILGGSDLVSAVVDEEEQTVLTVFEDAKTRSPAEFLQLARSAQWEMLDSSFDGTERDRLEGLFKF
ncbi:hypothetical protein, partial [Streptomyces sp. NPDC101206]|uniref:hypothetical protein n=1 Tax=Streptomyces sp. NPDC101206 TaxID=3366128 RepID=UPI00382CFF57